MPVLPRFTQLYVVQRPHIYDYNTLHRCLTAVHVVVVEKQAAEVFCRAETTRGPDGNWRGYLGTLSHLMFTSKQGMWELYIYEIVTFLTAKNVWQLEEYVIAGAVACKTLILPTIIITCEWAYIIAHLKVRWVVIRAKNLDGTVYKVAPTSVWAHLTH